MLKRVKGSSLPGALVTVGVGVVVTLVSVEGGTTGVAALNTGGKSVDSRIRNSLQQNPKGIEHCIIL